MARLPQGIQVVMGDIKKQGRKNRYPRHPSLVTIAPWAITPFMCAPVWPGETLKNLSFIAKLRSAGINTHHPIMGWWFEVFFYYVKHRDLDVRDQLTAFHVEGADVDDLITPADPKFYHGGYGINWTKRCLDAVVQADFRNKGETLDVSTIDGYPAAPIGNTNWMDSLILDQVGETDTGDLQGQFDVLPKDADPAFAAQYEHWERMKSVGLTDATYEDYLRSFGVRAPAEKREELHVPELIKHMRIFDYPKWDTQADGYAMLADPACTSDKDILFKEPGFVLGFCVAKPKVFMTKQTGSASEMMYTPQSWLPAVLHDQPYTSLIQVGADEGPIPGMDEAYWYDIRDIAVYGDQYVNFDPDLLVAPTNGYSVGVPLPKPNTDRRYATQADADRMFIGRTPLGGFIDMDSMSSLTIASPIYDTTRGVSMGAHSTELPL